MALSGLAFFAAGLLIIYYLNRSEDAKIVGRIIIAIVLWAPMAYNIFRKSKQASGIIGHLTSGVEEDPGLPTDTKNSVNKLRNRKG